MAYPQNYSQAGYQMQGMVLVPVQNEATVNNYLVGAGNTVAFVDFNGGVMWLKSTTALGVPEAVRKFEIKEIVIKPQESANDVTREEFSELKEQINRLCEALGEGKK